MTSEFDQQAARWDRWAPFYDSPGAAEHWDGTDAADLLAAEAGAGPALELGVGTGRIAIPLAAHGIPVTGIDASAAMLAKLERKRGPHPVTAHRTDMANPQVTGPFTLAYAAAGTLFCLLTQDRQVHCLTRVAALLTPTGRLVIEAAAPTHYIGQPGSLTVRDVGDHYLRIGARRHDPARQLVHFHEIHHQDGQQHLLTAVIRYASPAELDLMARLAGIRLRDRFANWRKTPYTGGGHISIYVPA